MAQSKEELISRQELLQVITDHTTKLGGGAPLQTATLAWVKALVQAMPAKAVKVDLVHCEDCKYFLPHRTVDTDKGKCERYGLGHLRRKSKTDFCSDGERRADHGTE